MAAVGDMGGGVDPKFLYFRFCGICFSELVAAIMFLVNFVKL